jgi:peptide/nickel transport system substrate-binding protein
MRYTPAIAASATLVVAAALAGCVSPSAVDETRSIRIGITSSNIQYQYDPVTAFIFALDTSGIYESLLALNPKTVEWEPCLATSWVLSEDRRTLTVELRDDVEFVGGTPLTAESVAEFFTLLAGEEEAYFSIVAAEYEASFTAIGQSTLEVVTSTPMDPPSGLLDNLWGQPIADPASMGDREISAESPRGTGPYLVDEVVPETSVTLVRNPIYWDPARYPYDDVTILAFDDDVARLNALKSGQIDAAPLGLNLAAEAEEAGLETHLSAAGRFSALWIADRAGTIVPALADLRVRKAIALAFDRSTIRDSIDYGYGLITSQPAVSTSAEYVPGGDDRYGYDLEEARRLMAEAGYADGFDVTIPLSSFLGIDEWAPLVEQSLSDIGIRATFDRFADAGPYFDAMMSGSYPIILYSEEPTESIRVFYGPDAVFNHPRFDDPVIEELWETVLSGSIEEAARARAEIGAYGLDQAWLAVFANKPYLWASRPGIAVEVTNSGYPQLLSFQNS